MKKGQKRGRWSRWMSARFRFWNVVNRSSIDGVMASASFGDSLVHLLMKLLFLRNYFDRQGATKDVGFFSIV